MEGARGVGQSVPMRPLPICCTDSIEAGEGYGLRNRRLYLGFVSTSGAIWLAIRCPEFERPSGLGWPYITP